MDINQVEKIIYTIRGHRVMLDSDLAELYGVETRTLNQAVKRNIERFPEDFMFQLMNDEADSLRSQIVISKKGKGGRRYQPLVFTESGVAMLSSVLNSSRAIQVNIMIMRAFIKLRSFLSMEQSAIHEVNALGEATFRMFRIVFERLDDLESVKEPVLPAKRKKLGLKKSKKKALLRGP